MKFKLLAPHYLPGDLLLGEGTVIGKGTQYDIDFTKYPPTHEMEGLDDESAKAAEAALKRFNAGHPIETLPITDGGIAGVKK